jgi:hypothetical protein
VRLESIAVGTYGGFLRLPKDRQQVMLAVLAKAARHLLMFKSPRTTRSGIDRDLIAIKPLVASMRRAKSRELIAEHYGSVPEGFLGALSKTSGPQTVIYYDLLFNTFVDPRNQTVALVVKQLPELDLNRLLTLLELDPVFLRPRFALKVKNEAEAKALNVTLGLIRQVVGGAANDEALRQSIRDMGERTPLATWASNWLRRVPQISYPALSLGDHWLPLDSGAKLTEAGLRLQLCVGTPSRIIGVLKGERFYFEYSKRGVIAEIQAIGPQRHLVLAGVHLAGNGIVPRVLRTEVERQFLAAGVPGLDSWPEDCPWRMVERVCRHEFPHTDDGFGLDRLEHDDFAGLEQQVAA